MNKILPIAALSASVLLTACGGNTKANADAQLTNQEKAVALLSSFETKDTSTLAYINSEKYVQHNLMAGDGVEGLKGLLSILPKTGVKADVVRAYTDGDYVFTHTEYNLFEPQIGFDIFRFEDGKMVEHWDNLQAKATSPNPSGRTQLDGATKAVDLDKTEANKALVADFVETILMKGEFNKVGNFFEGDYYLQHNTQIADGLSGLSKALAYLASQGIEMVYNKNHLVLGQGNFVLSVSEGSFAGKETSFYDLFRVENGKIVEHWDVIETILPKAQWKNSNGKF
ncbi:nuclear transport factor 2 family protein [Marinomonas sp. PE14-40]|uniref:nuclear transport factor 2 family protein n=1 Tax=Marinomonas sp. PE14-40 TaxID=3060621 RepID=UPI003F670C16